jgi:hypothetical protein
MSIGILHFVQNDDSILRCFFSNYQLVPSREGWRSRGGFSFQSYFEFDTSCVGRERFTELFKLKSFSPYQGETQRGLVIQ